MKELFSNIWLHPRTSLMGVLICVGTIAGVLDQQGVTLGHAGNGTTIALIGAIAAALLGLFAKDPNAKFGTGNRILSQREVDAAIKASGRNGSSMLRRMASVASVPVAALLAGSMLMAGCTGSQVNDVVAKINAYLPTAISLTNEALTIYAAVGSSSADDGSTPYRALSAVKADLAALQKPLADYLAATSGQDKTTSWSNVKAAIDVAVSDSDSLLAAAAVKNSEVQKQGVIVIAALDAAVHVLDGYVSSTQTTAEVQAKASRRAIKLDTVSRYWSDADKREISERLGAPYARVLNQAEALGF